MLKLSRYLKPWIGWILVVVCLLAGQAVFELAVPGQMQDIVNTGIQNGGVSDGVFEQLSENTMESLLVFATDDQKQGIESCYTLVTPSSATSEQKSSIPKLSDENVYILNDLDSDQKKSLEDDLSVVEVTALLSLQKAASQMGTSSTTDTSSDSSDETSSLATALSSLDPKMLQMMAASMDLESEQKEARDYMDNLGSSTVTSLMAQFAKAEYESLGIDMDALQQNYILHSGLIMMAYTVGSAICAILVGLLSARIAAGFSRNVRQKVFEKVTSFSQENYDQFPSATLITRTTNDVQQVQMAIVMMIRIVIYAPILGIGALFEVLASEADMAWIIGIAIICALILVIILFAVVMPKFRIMQKLTDRLNAVIRELLDGILVIRAFNREKTEEDKFDKANKDITSVSLFTSRAMALMMPILTFMMYAFMVAILWFGGKNVEAGIMQAGSIMAFIQYSMQVIMAFVMIAAISIMIPRANVAAGRIEEILEVNPSIQNPENIKTTNPSEKGILRFDDVSFAYPGSHREVLENLSFETKPGKVTAFIGATGSGKSTVANLIDRFYDVSSGSVSVDGTDVRDLDLHDLRSRIGYVPQQSILLKGTVESNLKYANENATDAEVQEAADISQSTDFINKKPEKMQAPIAQSGSNVSGGQKQRLSIGRALVKNPEILVFDDSFSALDYKTDARLRSQLMEKIKKTGTSVVLIAQRIATIMDADEIIVLEEGKVAGRGTHEQLMKTCPVYQEIASSQLGIEEVQ